MGTSRMVSTRDDYRVSRQPSTSWPCDLDVIPLRIAASQVNATATAPRAAFASAAQATDDDQDRMTHDACGPISVRVCVFGFLRLKCCFLQTRLGRERTREHVLFASVSPLLDARLSSRA